MTSFTPITNPTKLKLLLRAEELFAHHGLEALSARDIAAAAGQRNMSAVGYHFGGKDGLIFAILAQRMTPINERRLALIAAAEQGPVKQRLHRLARAMVDPLAETVGEGYGLNYIRFLAHVLTSGRLTEETAARVGHLAGWRRLYETLPPVLPEIGSTAFLLRMRLAIMLVVHALADWCEAEVRGMPGNPPLDQVQDALVDGIIALLRDKPRKS